MTSGMSPEQAAMEALSRNLSAELAAQGIRAICLRTTGSPETKIIDVAFELQAKAMGVTREELVYRLPVEEFRCRLAVPDEI